MHTDVLDHFPRTAGEGTETAITNGSRTSSAGMNDKTAAA